MHPDKVQGNEEDKQKAAEKFAEVSHGKTHINDHATILARSIAWSSLNL
jgi:hypothetical protein